MRIISGRAKGRRLRSPRGDETRPMMDRVREAIFSSLGDRVVDARVLDLYAGSGSLGLEALSRGAASATFVESGRAVLGTLRENIDLVALGGTVVESDVEAFVAGTAGRFDLVFVDPPYALAPSSVERLLGLLEERLADGATVVLHRRHGSEGITAPPGLEVTGLRRYGSAEITRLEKPVTG
jgi:16S rRNA (guanine966-N2)-methyltransferase